jgi:hypothetical protein
MWTDPRSAVGFEHVVVDVRAGPVVVDLVIVLFSINVIGRHTEARRFEYRHLIVLVGLHRNVE